MSFMARVFGRNNAAVVLSTNTLKLALNPAAVPGYQAGNTDVVLTVNSGVYLYSDTAATPALTVSGFVDGDSITIVNQGVIVGAAGTGGAANGGNGGNGGGAIYLGNNITIDNTAGYIAGGGGGGGGGGNGGTGGNGSYTSTTTQGPNYSMSSPQYVIYNSNGSTTCTGVVWADNTLATGHPLFLPYFDGSWYYYAGSLQYDNGLGSTQWSVYRQQSSTVGTSGGGGGTGGAGGAGQGISALVNGSGGSGGAAGGTNAGSGGNGGTGGNGGAWATAGNAGYVGASGNSGNAGGGSGGSGGGSGGAPGYAISLNSNTITWVNGSSSSSRAYGAVS